MLSIVIPSYCRADLLRPCLASVVRHAPAGSELLVVDDGNRDASIAEVAQSFAGVRLLRLPRRSGFAAAANAGIRATRGDIVQVLNDDTEVEPGWAEQALTWFTRNEVGCVAPLVMSWTDRHRVDSAGDRYYRGGVAAKRGQGGHINDYLEARPVFGASASSAFYRRSALEQVGLFPESFGSYFEDVDLAFRLQHAGHVTMYEPGSRVLHHGSASFGRKARRLLEQQSHNEERVFWRNMPGLWSTVPVHLAVLCGKALRRWHEGGLAPFLCGRLRILAELSAIRAHRAGLRSRSALECQVEETYWGGADRPRRGT